MARSNVPSDAPRSKSHLTQASVALLAQRLPEGWLLDVDTTSVFDAFGGGAAVVTVVGPDGGTGVVLVEPRLGNVAGRDILAIETRTALAKSRTGAETALVVAPFISATARDRLAESGLSYLDLTGNVRLHLARPGLFISDRGTDSDPGRGPGRPRVSLRGGPAVAVVRALLDVDREWTARQLAAESRASIGSTYRVLQHLDQEGLVEQGPDKRYRVDDWRRLLRRWSAEYDFEKENVVSRWIAPRGLDDFLRRVVDAKDRRYAVTGTLAAARWAAHAPVRTAVIYTDSPEDCAIDWDLRPTDVGVNVLLAVPATESPFLRTVRTPQGAVAAAPAQVVVDLLNGPGRNPSEGEELLRWMEGHVDDWRR